MDKFRNAVQRTVEKQRMEAVNAQPAVQQNVVQQPAVQQNVIQQPAVQQNVVQQQVQTTDLLKLKENIQKEINKDTRDWHKKEYLYINFKIPIWYIILVIALVVILIFFFSREISKFENKTYDPYGMGIRHYISRDDTGAVETSLEERQVGGKNLKLEPMVEQLTSAPEPPNFSEYYNIEANIKDGSVMIDRENFENSALSLDKLLEANKGL
jgi:hypothetical protein